MNGLFTTQFLFTFLAANTTESGLTVRWQRKRNTLQLNKTHSNRQQFIIWQLHFVKLGQAKSLMLYWAENAIHLQLSRNKRGEQKFFVPNKIYASESSYLTCILCVLALPQTDSACRPLAVVRWRRKCLLKNNGFLQRTFQRHIQTITCVFLVRVYSGPNLWNSHIGTSAR